MILNTPHQQIDHVLTILKKHGSFLSFEELNGKVKQSKIVVEPSVLRMILEKLERDNYVFLDPTHGSKYYSASFEGVLFMGYEAKALQDEADALWKQSEITRQRDLDTLLATNSTRLTDLNKYLAIGTIAAAVVGVAILIFQWYAYLHPISPPK